MMTEKTWRWRKGTLRIYLTGWYVLWLGCTLFLFSGYLYFTLKHSLVRQLDKSLQITASETLDIVVKENDKLKFEQSPITKTLTINQRIKKPDLVLYLLTNQGEIWDSLGSNEKINLQTPLQEGYTFRQYHHQTWRFYSQPITVSNLNGWLQVGESFQVVKEATNHLLTVMLFSCPLILIIVSLGGLFLADRALSPIDHIMKTTEMINADDFTKRINYHGNFNEISKLAMTIDQMLDRLQTAFNQERRFTSDASHELRTPLTIIKGKIEVTLSRGRQIEEYKKTLQDVEKEVNHLIRLINCLLFLSQLEQEENEHHFNKNEVDLSNLLEVLAEQQQLLAQNREIEFYKQITPNLIILGNSDYLTSLFLNLLDNALKYTPNQGKIKIMTQLESEYIVISITNTGLGIEPEHLPYIFQRFYRTENARSRQTGGSGLGLAIAQEIAILHGGFIKVKSEINKETNFSVYLINN